MFSISNEELSKLPDAKKGMMIRCRECGGEHPLRSDDDFLMYIKCGDKTFLRAINGKLLEHLI